MLMKKANFHLPKRLTALLLTLVCVLGLFPVDASAASDSITLKEFGHSGVAYQSAALGRCTLHEMTFKNGNKSTVGFCGTKGGGMGSSLKNQTWGRKTAVSNSAVEIMMAYYYAHTTGVFTDEAVAIGANDVWDSGYTWYMNAWVQACIWRWKQGSMSDPVVACAEELMAVYNTLENTHYTSIDQKRDDLSFRDRTQFIFDLGAQGVWGKCAVYEYSFTGAGSTSHPAGSVQKIILGELTVTSTPDTPNPPTVEYVLVVRKVDSTNPNKGLPGAGFHIESQNGVYKKDVITGENGVYRIAGLTAGTYVVTETSAPAGYQLDSAALQYVTIPNSSSNTVTVTFQDSPDVTGEGSIRKVDADDPSKGLAGAVIKIKGVDNSFTGTYTTSEGGWLDDVPWDSMPIGSYSAEEITPPEGYTKSPDQSKVKQSFHWDGKSDVSLVFENDSKVKVKLMKLDDSNNPLPGAVFNIIKDGQIIGTEATDENGSITITDVTEGMYAFMEVSAPAPYAKLTEPVIVHVDQATINGGGIVTVTASDKKLPNLTILKRDAKTGDVIPNTNFEIRGIHYGFHNDVTTGADGKAVLTGIPVDSYEVTEKSVPDPYVVGDEPTQTIWLEAGDSKELIFDNLKQPTLKIAKIEKEVGTKIPGTVFTVEGVDSDYRQDVTTGTDGSVTLRVMPGSYTITEKSVPAPYVVSDEPTQTISLNAGDEKELIFENQKQPLLRIAKIEKGSRTKIPGTVFLLEAIDSDYRQNVTTGKDGWVELRVASGSYRVTEQSVPEPYVIGSERTKTISLNPGDEKEITFENLKKPELTLSKIDADTQKPIPGTVLRVEAVNGDYQDDWTTGADGKVKKYVAPGIYRVTEISVPAPYYLPDKDADRVQTISLNPGDEKTLVFKNRKSPELTIFKEDSVAGAPIEGARFHVTYTSNGEAADAPATIDFGYFVTDASGQIKLHEKGKKLYPGEYTVTEVAPAPGFQMKEPTTQKVIIHGNESKTVTFQNEPLNALIVEKYDSVTGEALPGCTFQLRYLGGTSGTGGTVIGQKVTGKNGTAIWTGLKPGTYLVEEIDPADGYSIINASETVYLADSGEQSVVTVRFDNAPDGILLIRKVCSVNPSVTLADAEFKITYADGTLIGDSNGIYKTDEKGEIRIPGLKPGKSVIVTEVKAPAGFLIDTQSQTIQIKEGRTVSLTFKNQPKGELIVQKRDSITGQPLPGAEFRITTAAGCEVGLNGVIGTATLTQGGIFKTDNSGEIRISNLAPGAYVLTEVKAPDGYVMDTPSKNVVIGTNGDTQTVIITNTPKGGLVVEKYDKITKKPLSGATFKIINANGEFTPDNEGLTSSNGLYTSDVNGQIILSKLLPGTYIVTEEKAPDNYRKDPTPQTVVVNPRDTQTVRFYDEPLCSLTILKRDAVTRKPLANAQFLVRDSEGKNIGPNNGLYTTGSDGTVTVSGLEPNATIVVSEQKAPAGYIKNETPKNIVVRSGVANSLIFDNEPGTTLVIHKYIEGTENEPLSGVAFKIVDGSGAAIGPDDGIYFTDKSGDIVLNGIEPGTTVIAREIKTVEGFVLDGTPQDILIKAGEMQELTFWNKRDCSLTILKQSTSKEPLTGAVFHVTDEDGAAIGTNNGRYTTDRNGLITITGLQPGQVLVITEEKAPNGYIRDMTPKVIKIKQGAANSLIFENAHAGSLVINKRSSVDKKTPLEGVTFKITTTSGEFLPDENSRISSSGLYYTDEAGQIILNGVVGTLVVTEMQTIDGYTIHEANRTQTVEVKPDDTQTLYFYNDPLCSLTLKKLDSVTGKPVPGTEFTVRDGSGAILGRYTTGKDGTVVVTGLIPNSTVVVCESKVPSGYVLDTTPKTIIVRNGTGNSFTSGVSSGSGTSSGGNDLTFENDPKMTLTIHKYIEGTANEPLAGVAFKVVDGSGKPLNPNGGIYYTNSAGEIILEDLEPGTTITAQEIKTVDGYVLDGRPQSIKIEAGKAQNLTFWNKPAGSLTIRKLDKLTGKPLAGVEFELMYAKGGYVDTDNGHLSSKGLYMTNDHGEIHISGVTGTIVVKETRPLPGYTIEPGRETQTVTVNPQETQTLTFYNIPANTLTIQKYVDGSDNEPLAGVEFLVTDSTGAVVGPNNGYYTTDKDGRISIPGLIPGTVITVKETKTLDGYILDNKSQSITIKEGEAQSLTFRNKKAGGLIINKIDAATKKPLAGVKFRITYADGKNVDMEGGKISSNGIYTTDSMGQIKILGIVGTVIVEEIETIPGYVIDPNAKSQTVQVNANDTQTITFTNTPKQTLVIQKLVTGTKDQPLAGVEFLVTDSSGATVGPNNGIYRTDAQGRITITDLAPGTVITAKETKTAEGYVLDSTPQSMEIKSGEVQTLTFYNAPAGGLELIKVNESDKTQRIPNVKFEIRKMDGALVKTVTTDSTGRVHVNLDAGDYYAVEIEVAKGFKLDSTPHYFTVRDNETTTLTVTNKPFSGILIHKIDSITKKGISGVTFLLYDSTNTPVGQYTSDNSGHVYIEGITAAGRYYLRELENKGYITDTQMKTVYLKPGETTLVEWENTPITGQIQITKKSADYNSTNGLPAGTLLEGAVFEIYDKASNLVDTIKSDSRGLAVSRQLPLGRYTIRETKAPANYGVNNTDLTAYLEHEGEIVRFEVTNKSLATGVAITKTGPAEVMAGQPVRYVLSGIANTSNVRLENFYWRDTLPAEVRLDKIVTGTYNFPGTYKITYRVNGGEAQTLADNLSTQKNYTLAASATALGLASNQRVTEIMFVFGQAPAGFAQVEKTMLYCNTVSPITSTSFVNKADVGGTYNGVWVQAVSRWVTKVYGKPVVVKLPRTGY